MKNLLKVASIVLASTAIFFSCRKSETLTSDSVNSKAKTTSSAADGVWDVLGYGYDVTLDVLDDNALSDSKIIDVAAFYADFPSRIDPSTSGITDSYFYSGATAHDFLEEMNRELSGGIKPIFGSPDSKDGYFNGSADLKSVDHTKKTFSSKYSYATFESYRRVKRLRFTEDATIGQLSTYLTPDFISNVNTLSATALIERYGTHVLLDISLGGRLRYSFNATLLKQNIYENRLRGIKASFGLKILSKFGIDVGFESNTTEINQITSEIHDKDFRARAFGGTNSGSSISVDANGNISNTFNFSSWEQSVNVNNCVVVGIGNAVPLYEFITDPVKKSQVITATQDYIEARKYKLDYTDELVNINRFGKWGGGHRYLTSGWLNEPSYWGFEGVAFKAYIRQVPETVPVYAFWSQSGSDHYYSTSPSVGNNPNNYWVSQGVAFYVHNTQLPGTVPVYDHYSSQGSEHYFSTASYIGSTSYWQNNGIVFYVYP